MFCNCRCCFSLYKYLLLAHKWWGTSPCVFESHPLLRHVPSSHGQSCFPRHRSMLLLLLSNLPSDPHLLKTYTHPPRLGSKVIFSKICWILWDLIPALQLSSKLSLSRSVKETAELELLFYRLIQNQSKN